jgi:hypothetical protein
MMYRHTHYHDAVRKLHLLYESRHVITCVDNFTEEKSYVSMFTFPTGSEFKTETSNFVMSTRTSLLDTMKPNAVLLFSRARTATSLTRLLRVCSKHFPTGVTVMQTELSSDAHRIETKWAPGTGRPVEEKIPCSSREFNPDYLLV